MNDTLPLFDAPDPDRSYRRPKNAQSEKTKTRPKWSRYRPKNPVRCDDCMAQLAETGGREPTWPLNARWQRKAGGARRLLCYQHALIWRAHDNLPTLAKE